VLTAVASLQEFLTATNIDISVDFEAGFVFARNTGPALINNRSRQNLHELINC
jgi:hypothetical protein